MIFMFKIALKTLIILVFLTSCQALKPKKVDKSVPVNAEKRARQAVDEGRGISLEGLVGGRKGTNYEFSTSNPMWRASLETLDFLPLTTVDYSGGIIITDWYYDNNSSRESIKISLRFLSNDIKKKIALFCNLNVESVITAKDVDIIYEIPLVLHKEGLDDIILENLKIWTKEPDFSKWENIVSKIKKLKKEVTIGVVGKYIDLKDAYKSLHEALYHASFHNNVKLKINYIDSEDLQKETPKNLLSDCDGILVPGGFGNRGFEGKISAIKYAREKNIPFFGICLGLQMAVVEYARNVCDLKNANSRESGRKIKDFVIDIMEDQKNLDSKGGNMRLGDYPCEIKKSTKVAEAYRKTKILERHRHRYEVNPKYHNILSKKGLILSGLSPDGKLAETIEIKEHPWFVACQFHPEFKSKPFQPHPLFVNFIKASSKKS